MVEFWNAEDLINEEAIEAMDPVTMATVLEMLTKAGY